MKQHICGSSDIEQVEIIRQQLPDLSQTVKLFKALADETRLKIAYALTLEQQLCVCDVAEVINASVATASHHLRYLKENGLAQSNRVGKQMYYMLKDEHVRQIIQNAYEHSEEVSEYDTKNDGVQTS